MCCISENISADPCGKPARLLHDKNLEHLFLQKSECCYISENTSRVWIHQRGFSKFQIIGPQWLRTAQSVPNVIHMIPNCSIWSPSSVDNWSQISIQLSLIGIYWSMAHPWWTLPVQWVTIFKAGPRIPFYDGQKRMRMWIQIRGSENQRCTSKSKKWK